MSKRNVSRMHLPGQLILLALLALLPLSASSESGAYRIEILIFRYSNSTATPYSTEQISHFPRAWRLFEPRLRPIAEDPAPLGAMSDPMRSAWRSLERNEDFEPLEFQTWEQSRIDYHPPIRMHDDEVLFERLEVPGSEAWVDLTADDLFAPYRESWYRLDGTAQLRRTRFLHLDLNLEFRVELLPAEEGLEPLPDPTTSAIADVRTARTNKPTVTLKPAPYWNPPAPLTTPQVSLEPPVPGALVHRLQESRQIRTGEVQYFDTPYLGVLARVTATDGE